MPKRVDQVTYNTLLDAYRDDPGNHSEAARRAGVTRRTAKTGWFSGWPDRPFGSKAIKDLLEEEKTIAGARMQLEDERAVLEEDKAFLAAEADREAQRQRAIKVREAEAAMISGIRGATSHAVVAALQTAGGLKSAMTRLSSELEQIAGQGPLSAKEVGHLSAIMRRYSSTLRELAAAGQIAMEMERLYMGEPSQIVGVLSDYDSMPLDDLVKAAGYQDQVLRRAAERGLVVLEGGLGKSSESKTS